MHWMTIETGVLYLLQLEQFYVGSVVGSKPRHHSSRLHLVSVLDGLSCIVMALSGPHWLRTALRPSTCCAAPVHSVRLLEVIYLAYEPRLWRLYPAVFQEAQFRRRRGEIAE